WALVQRTNQAWYQSLGKALIDYCPVGVRKHLWLLTLGLVGLLCCPFPHQVSCHNELHPVQRRFLAAPFEGVLESVLARSEHATSLQNCFAAFHQFSGVVNRQNAEPRQIEALTEYCQLAGTEDAVFLPLSAEGRPVGGMLVGMSAAQLEGRGFGESAA
ncbi:MAG: hypothetical protein ACK53V_24450, partial [Planctomycetota bacterium]